MSEQVSHTPGPWGWDSRNTNYYLLSLSPESPEQIVAQFERIPMDAIGDADMALIAAAPELLAILKDMLTVFDAKSADPMKTYDPVQIVALARAVVATAEGE